MSKTILVLVITLLTMSIVNAQNKEKNKTVVKPTKEKITVTQKPVVKSNTTTQTVQKKDKIQVASKLPNGKTRINSSSKTKVKNSTNTGILKPVKKTNTADAEREFLQNKINSKYKIKDPANIERAKKEKADKTRALKKQK